MRKLFICGCARSGTTALTRLLNAHSDIEISVEKYQSEFRAKNDSFKKIKLDSTKHVYVGDKVPSFYKNYKKVFSAFPDATMYFIFRNIFDVAQSYKSRKEHETNPWKKGPRMAVREWNESLRNTLDHMDKKKKIVPLVYEKVFFQRTNILKELPEIEADKKFIAHYKKSIKHSVKIEKNREVTLSSKDKVWILNNADFESYRKLFAIAHV